MVHHTAEQIEIIAMAHGEADAADMLRKIRAHDGLVKAMTNARDMLRIYHQFAPDYINAKWFSTLDAEIVAALKATGGQ